MTTRIEPKPKEHKNPDSEQRRERIASAPYNFIPLPEVVVTAEGLPDHNTYADGKFKHTGYFDVTLTTKSPLYVRAPLTLQEFEKQERGDEPKDDFRALMKNKADFFYTRKKESPVIPGSSLRGMLRNLLEIVSYGKMTRVTDKQLFYRTVDDTSVGVSYRNRMGEDKVEQGYLRKKDGRYFIQTCERARVPRELLTPNPAELYDRFRGIAVPRWHLPRDVQTSVWVQHKECWVALHTNGWLVTKISAHKFEDGLQGRLVITGDMPNQKLKEFVFLKPTAEAEQVDISEELLERFHDDQLTQWQERAFPMDAPRKNIRERDGMLPRDLEHGGEPVFFLREPDDEGKLQVTFLGRARMFRLPYQNSPRDLLPEPLRDPMLIDFAEAMFGYVREDKNAKQGEKARAYASRVFVTDARLIKEYAQDNLWLTRDAITPPILATPKPTAFQQYLVQLTDVKRKLSHYDSPTFDNEGELLSEKTTLRGHKLYWHQGNPTADELGEKDQQHRRNGRVKDESTQHTQFRPVREGVEFKFRVYFENLSAEDLGALCWTLQPLGETTEEFCHALGMGKPFGMGAVKLDATLHLTDRKTRYGALFSDKGWAEGETTVEKLDRHALETRVAPFEQYILQELQPNEPVKHLYELPRIAMLLKMMGFPGFSAEKVLEGSPANQQNRMLANHPNTRYMMIQIPGVQRDRNEYKERPVLPDVTAFMTEQEKKTAQPIAYRKGARLKATVHHEDDGFVFLDLPNQDAEKRYGIIDPEKRQGREFAQGELAAIEIVDLDKDEQDVEIVVCAPV